MAQHTEFPTPSSVNVADPGIEQASSILGNIANEWNSTFPYGVAGMIETPHESPFSMRQYLGAMDARDEYGYNIYWDAVEHGHLDSMSSEYIGSYLVRSAADITPVPIPGSAALLASALLVFARLGWSRKRRIQ